MNKLLAIVKREYTQRVRARMFIVTTVLLPVAMAMFGIAPALVLSIESGTPMRVVVLDGTGKLFGRLRGYLQAEPEPATQDDGNPTARNNPIEKARQQSFVVEQASTVGSSVTQVQVDLERRLAAKEIDAYLILPPDVLQSGRAQFFRRNTSDLISTRKIQEALDSAIREQRLMDAHVDQQTMMNLARQ